MIVCIYFQVVSIFSELFEVFYQKIHLQVLVLKKSTMSKLIRVCKPLVAKNGYSLVEADLLSLAPNLAIASFSDQSFY